jgi:hypothetical protein
VSEGSWSEADALAYRPFEGDETDVTELSDKFVVPLPPVAQVIRGHFFSARENPERPKGRSFLFCTHSERNLSNKIGRGTFTAIFFVQCMEAIGCHTIHIENT